MAALITCKWTKMRFRSHLYTRHLPDPDLVVRTSGEMRLSNFLLWQLAYAEIYVTPTLWPEFRGCNFWKASPNTRSANGAMADWPHAAALHSRIGATQRNHGHEVPGTEEP